MTAKKKGRSIPDTHVDIEREMERIRRKSNNIWDGKSEPTNKDRASWAMEGLQEFARVVGEDIDEEGLETVISDLLADLRHLCDSWAISYGECDQRGHTHYTEEVVEERNMRKGAKGKQGKNEGDLLLAIQELMDGVEWSPDTLEAIAELLTNNGYKIRDMNDETVETRRQS